MYNIKPIINISKHVALVGNSDCLLNKDYSKEIDSYEDVIRFNFANILPQYTGTKTTIRWINCEINIPAAREHCKQVKTDEDLRQYIIKHFCNVKLIAWESIKDKLLLYTPNINVYKPNGLCTLKNINTYLDTHLPNIKTRFNDDVTDCWPRTGFQAILTCIQSGCIVHLYGFDTVKKEIIHHYSKNHKYIVDKIKHHQVKIEIDILNELIQQSLVINHTL